MPSAPDDRVQSPPRTLPRILRHIGPGFILAGALVGSGELIATTATGAESGFSLLWLIILGCVVKVFVQIEIGRQTITHNQSALTALNQIPGPRISIPWRPQGRRVGANWIVICWLCMFMATLLLFGGIIGGIGQSLAMTWPLTESGRAYNAYQDQRIALTIRQTERAHQEGTPSPAASETAQETQTPSTEASAPPVPADDRIWAVMITALTILALYWGRYGFIERFALILVGTFTLITLFNLVQLQAHDSWAIALPDLMHGLHFALPPKDSGSNPLITALATFGIIGVGASDLVAYPYWCLEKGYARWTGPNDHSKDWEKRAQGWLRVLQWDAWSACLLYTFTTVAFYLLGASVLGRVGLVPEGAEMIRTLAVMYEPVFGSGAQFLFLFGAFAVLYSTFFIGNAGHCRLATDVLAVVKVTNPSDSQRGVWMKVFAIVLPILCVAAYYTVGSPVLLVMIGGIAQALLLPMVAFAALHFRFRQCHPALRPSRFWDLMLVVAFLAFTVIGIYLVYAQFN